MNTIQPDDLIVWPDDTCCLGENLHEYTHMSDDYVVLKEGTDEYQSFCTLHGL